MAAKLSMGTYISWTASSLQCQLLLSHSTQELGWDLALVVLGTLDQAGPQTWICLHMLPTAEETTLLYVVLIETILVFNSLERLLKKGSL